MHIPDGYLSPSTCAALYAGAVPFWWVAVRRVGRVMHTRLVPLLSLVAAFSFVIMMFNVPLPGGTTGHATGVGIATAVLGPWASMLALSVALVIQALFFGDGGITALGANCFNIAIAGSLVAHLVYRLASARAGWTARRRAIAAGLAGYAGVNAAAFCAAVEFGIQPALFTDASGAPLYGPYPLSVAIPAMMVGHLAVAGLAEAFVSGGIVAFLQRSNPGILRLGAAPIVPAAGTATLPPARSLRPLWIGLGVVMLLTPLGVLASGTAWGEWSASEFTHAAGRQAIAAASGGRTAPAVVPSGLARLSSVWTAPWGAYAPPLVHSPAVGYALSALFGGGLVLLASLVVVRASSAVRRKRATGERVSR